MRQITQPTKSEIQELLTQYPLWNQKEEAGVPFLTFDYQFRTFQEAFLFLTKLAFVSESLDHHAEIWNVYNKVRLKIYTHDTKSISSLDLEFVKRLMERTSL